MTVCVSRRPKSRRCRGALIKLAVLIVALWAPWARSGPVTVQAAAAQPAVDVKELDKVRRSVLSGRTPLSGNEAQLRTWYVQRLVAMTQASEGVSAIRQELMNDLNIASRSGSAETQAFLRDNVFLALLPKLIANARNDAARINALLILGELNDVEAQLRGAEATPPVPAAAARKELMNVVSTNPSIALKVAALVGLRRHATLEMLAGGQRLGADAAAMVSLMVQLLQASPPPPGQLAGHHWMQRLAAEIVGIFGTPGRNGEVVIALDKLVRDEQLPDWLRCATLDALGRITMPAQLQLDPAQTVAAAGKLALQSCTAATAQLEQWEAKQAKLDPNMIRAEAPTRRAPEPPRAEGRPKPEGRRNPRRNRDEPDAEVAPKPLDLGLGEPGLDLGQDIMLAARRRLKHQLGCVRNGISSDPAKGVRALAKSGPVQTTVDQLDKQLEALLAAIDQTGIQPAQLRQTIQTSAQAISGLVAAGPAAPAAAAPNAPAAADANAPAATAAENPF